MKLIDKIIKKAIEHQTKADSFCGEIVIELFKKYKKTRDDDIEDVFVEGVGCFSQAGDGLVLNDEIGSNIPVSFIVGIIEEKGHFTYSDFMNLRI